MHGSFDNNDLTELVSTNEDDFNSKINQTQQQIPEYTGSYFQDFGFNSILNDVPPASFSSSSINMSMHASSGTSFSATKTTQQKPKPKSIKINKKNLIQREDLDFYVLFRKKFYKIKLFEGIDKDTKLLLFARDEISSQDGSFLKEAKFNSDSLFNLIEKFKNKMQENIILKKCLINVVMRFQGKLCVELNSEQFQATMVNEAVKEFRQYLHEQNYKVFNKFEEMRRLLGGIQEEKFETTMESPAVLPISMHSSIPMTTALVVSDACSTTVAFSDRAKTPSFVTPSNPYPFFPFNDNDVHLTPTTQNPTHSALLFIDADTDRVTDFGEREYAKYIESKSSASLTGNKVKNKGIAMPHEVYSSSGQTLSEAAELDSNNKVNNRKNTQQTEEKIVVDQCEPLGFYLWRTECESANVWEIKVFIFKGDIFAAKYKRKNHDFEQVSFNKSDLNPLKKQFSDDLVLEKCSVGTFRAGNEMRFLRVGLPYDLINKSEIKIKIVEKLKYYYMGQKYKVSDVLENKVVLFSHDGSVAEAAESPAKKPKPDFSEVLAFPSTISGGKQAAFFASANAGPTSYRVGSKGGEAMVAYGVLSSAQQASTDAAQSDQNQSALVFKS